MPRAAAALAMTANKKLDSAAQLNHFTRFITDHLDEGEYERLLATMMEGDLPHDAVHRAARAVATWGTARPYPAVITLSLFTGHNWRNIRAKLVDAGIANPMTLPSLHSVLDITEDIVVDSLFRSGDKREGPPSEGERKVRQFYDAIYAPEAPDTDDVDSEEFSRVPAGFEDPADVEADFDAFMRAPK
jgi:hypothetical protein